MEEHRVDFILGLPGKLDSIMTVIDRLSRMAHFIPCSSTLTAEGCANLLIDRVVKYHGVPEEVVSDRDPKFTSAFWASVCEALGIRRMMSTAAHPQTDGATERCNGTIGKILRCLVEDTGKAWLACLPFAEMAYNSAVASAIGFSPYALNLGYDPVLPHDLPLPKSCTSDTAAAFMKRMEEMSVAARSAAVKASERMKLDADYILSSSGGSGVRCGRLGNVEFGRDPVGGQGQAVTQISGALPGSECRWSGGLQAGIAGGVSVSSGVSRFETKTLVGCCSGNG